MTRSAYKVVMTDYDFPDLDYERAELGKAGADFVALQCQTEAELVATARDADAVINEYFRPISRAVIAGLERCRIIARTGIGVDTIDIPAATERGIYVTNVPDYCVEDVSDHVIALLLACARRLSLLDGRIRGGAWGYQPAKPMHRLGGKVLGLIGYGKIARRVVPKARALGMAAICCDPHLDPAVPAADGVEATDLAAVLTRSDVVSIHVPLSAETRGMIGRAELALMKPTAFIINTSRGPVLNQADLVEALQQRRIAGAGLDVLDREPPDATEPLARLDSVVLTPHCAWYSEESIAELKAKYVADVIRALSGERPRYVVNADVRPRWREGSP